MRQIVFSLILVTWFGGVAIADESPSTAAPPTHPVEEQTKHDEAIKKAEEAYHNAVIAADQQYVSDLDAALKEAMKNLDIDSARVLDDQKKAAIALLQRDQSQTKVTMIGANTVQQGASLSLPPGCQFYLWEMASGGGTSSGLLTQGTTLHLENARGFTAAQFSIGTQNANNFATNCGVYAIGGVGVSGARHAKGFYCATTGQNAGSAIVRFVLTAPATIVALGSAGSQNNLKLSGLDSLVTDAHSPDGHDGVALTIGHVALSPGTYSISETTTDAPHPYDPDSNADLLGVFVFSDDPAAATSDNPEIPITGSTPIAAIVQESGTRPSP